MRNIQLDDDLVEVIQADDESIDRTARELIVLELYRRGSMSSGKAAQLLGMSRVEFIRYSGQLGIPYFDTTDDEWEAELRTIRSA
ncbi:MAG: UPF0175 family protein [Thermomicrobiales bacterium]